MNVCVRFLTVVVLLCCVIIQLLSFTDVLSAGIYRYSQ